MIQMVIYGECLRIVLLYFGHNSEILFTHFSLISKAEGISKGWKYTNASGK
jgi:hypothetical protein